MQEIIDHKMTAHVFGDISSSSCSSCALSKTAADIVRNYGEDATCILKQNAEQLPSCKIGCCMIYKVTLLCEEGGLNLMNFPSNHVSVLRSIPNELRKDGVKDKDLNLDTLPENKALGVKFNIQENTLGFIIRVNDKPVTKRELQAALSSVYDFIGLGSPFH